jgi:hypothetical protein
VVDRTRRDEYMAALDDANAGDLRRLVRLFCELEIVALRSELVGGQAAADMWSEAEALVDRTWRPPSMNSASKLA